jgi:NTP pyrophosphatase (non-canonical NTP hydrolase)
MDFQEMLKRAREIKAVNAQLAQKDNCTEWGLEQRTMGFVGDVGSLAKLVMAKSGYRKYDDLDKKLAHELGDCLWAIMTIADEAGVNLEKAFLDTMNEIEQRNK